MQKRENVLEALLILIGIIREDSSSLWQDEYINTQILNSQTYFQHIWDFSYPLFPSEVHAHGFTSSGFRVHSTTSWLVLRFCVILSYCWLGLRFCLRIFLCLSLWLMRILSPDDRCRFHKCQLARKPSQENWSCMSTEKIWIRFRLHCFLLNDIDPFMRRAWIYLICSGDNRLTEALSHFWRTRCVVGDDSILGLFLKHSQTFAVPPRVFALLSSQPRLWLENTRASEGNRQWSTVQYKSMTWLKFFRWAFQFRGSGGPYVSNGFGRSIISWSLMYYFPSFLRAEGS